MLIFYSYRWKKSCSETISVNDAAAAAAQKNETNKNTRKKNAILAHFPIQKCDDKKSA